MCVMLASKAKAIIKSGTLQQRTVVLTTKDDDFRSLSLLRGAPPKVIWLVVGNTSTAEILRILVERVDAIEAFINEPSAALLALRKS